MSDATYITTRGRRIASIFLGALVGGALMALPLAGVLSQGAAYDYPFSMLAGYLAGSFALCSLMWLAGIALFGFPLWLLIGRMRASQGWRMALVCGAILPPICLALLLILVEGLDAARLAIEFRWSSVLGREAALGAALVAGMGCVVGLAVWRFAYRRTLGPANDDTFA
jgi:hypothetical protein